VNCCDHTRKQYKAPISLSPEVYETSSKAGSRIRILYLLTGPVGSKDVCWDMSAVDSMLWWKPSDLFTYTSIEYIWSVDVGLLYFHVNAELIILVDILSRNIFFKDAFWLKSAVCFSEQITTSNLYRHSSTTNLCKHTFVASFIFQFGEFDFFGWTVTLKLYIIWQINCSDIYWYFHNINLDFYKLLVVLTYYWSLRLTSIKLLSHCKHIDPVYLHLLTIFS